VAKEEIKKIPLIGHIAMGAQAIFVKRETGDSKYQVVSHAI
jgi:1-acyl-sn-glycerol-3-phosphate acyltransferase